MDFEDVECCAGPNFVVKLGGKKVVPAGSWLVFHTQQVLKNLLKAVFKACVPKFKWEWK